MAMTDARKARFTIALSGLASLYGRKLDAVTIAAYWGVLQRLDDGAVMFAINTAPSKYLDWFPTGGQLAELAREKARSKAVRREADDTRRALPLPETEDPYEGRESPPLDATEHKAYITAAKKLLERLARLWECERIQSGRSLSASTPLHVGQQRFKDFWKTWVGSDE